MDVNKLVQMANQIGSFYAGMPDRERALLDIANHIRRFWAPRMRKELLQHVDEQGDTDLVEIVRETVRTHRADIQ